MSTGMFDQIRNVQNCFWELDSREDFKINTSVACFFYICNCTHTCKYTYTSHTYIHTFIHAQSRHTQAEPLIQWQTASTSLAADYVFPARRLRTHWRFRTGQQDGRGWGFSGRKVAFYQIRRVRRGLVECGRGRGLARGVCNGKSGSGEATAQLTGSNRVVCCCSEQQP